VHFLSQAAATDAKLAFVDSNGRVIVKVDNTTNGAGDPSFGRNTVYLESNELMSIGSLLIFDANHMPFGVRFPHATVPKRPTHKFKVLCLALAFHARPDLAGTGGN
jgi:hypothetical protein